MYVHEFSTLTFAFNLKVETSGRKLGLTPRDVAAPGGLDRVLGHALAGV